jgi:thioredoxin-related protein
MNFATARIEEREGMYPLNLKPLLMNMLLRVFTLAIAAQLVTAVAQAKPPEGWPFVEVNQASRIAERQNKPMFIYFGFPTCPYCEIANKKTFSNKSLRKRYTEHYVLAYFDVRGNPEDMITLPGGEKMTRADAMMRLKSTPVPAWLFVSPEGKEILRRRGSATPVEAFVQFDQYVSSREYQRTSFEEYLAQRGLHEAQPGK